ncbi:MAG: radical SAM protein [Candidatus Aenigmarchaeota archaeon]|nr:radical SAM protein [Candidatus Aenigmarchaeota archaeon]
MRILMLNPPYLPRYSRQSRSPCVTKGGTFYYPYFLAYATGNLEKQGFTDVKLVDAVANEWSHEETLKFIETFRPDLVIMDTSTPSIYNDVSFANKIKQSLPPVHISLVGTHPSRLPDETMKLSKSIDSICRGEYDNTVVDLADKLERGKKLKTVKGLTYREKNKVIHNPNREFIKNLDELPFVSEVYKRHFGEKGIKKYFYASLLWPQVTILTARGCPFSCSFCQIPFKGSYRYRSPENVVEEFEYIQNELPYVREIMIEDDTFPVIRERTRRICRLLIKKKIKLKWSCNARVDTDFETLKLMKKAGCRLLCVGFETPKQEALDNVHKKTTKQLQIDFMMATKKIGLLVNGCFILGLPGDTKETIGETIEFAKELNPDTAQFYPLMVYPGTEAYEWAKRNGYLMTEDYSKWLTKDGLHTTTVSRPDLSAEELVKACDRARKEFYMRPRYIAGKFMQSVLHPAEFTRNVKSFKIFFKYLLKGSLHGDEPA